MLFPSLRFKAVLKRIGSFKDIHSDANANERIKVLDLLGTNEHELVFTFAPSLLIVIIQTHGETLKNLQDLSVTNYRKLSICSNLNSPSPHEL